MNAIRSYTVLMCVMTVATNDDLSGSLEHGQLPCKVEVKSFSAKYFVNWLKLLDANFASLKLVFSKTTNVTSVPGTILPTDWTWTYIPSTATFRYLKWPIDFNILSLGLLSGYSLAYRTELYMNVTPSDCHIEIGNITTDRMISAAMLKMTDDYFKDELPPDYKHSFWCYYARRDDSSTPTYLQRIAEYFAFPMMNVGYKCCQQYVHLKTNKLYFRCHRKIITYWRECVIIPYILGVVFFVYFPIYLMKTSKNIIASGRHIQTRHIPKDTAEEKEDRQSVENSDELTHVVVNNTQNTSNQTDDMDDEFILLNGDDPISISKYAFSLCKLSNNHPICVSRFRRLLFIIIAPAVVLFEILAYKHALNDFVLAMIEQKVPLGFLSMLGGFTKSADNFLSAFGGPYIVMLVYLVVGTILLVCPVSVDQILESGLPADHKYRIKSLLTLDLRTIEERSLYLCRCYSGYGKTYHVFLANLFMIINPQSWIFFVKFQLSRFENTFGVSFESRYRVRYYALLVLYAIPCFLEFIGAVCYYSCPLISLTVFVCRGYTSLLFATIRNRFIKLKFPIVLIYAIMSIFFLYTLCLIFITSFSFLGKILFFIYLAVLVYPTYSFGYIFFVMSFIFYIWRNVTSFRDDYTKLLAKIVNIARELDRESTPKVELHGSILFVDMQGDSEVEVSEIQINNCPVPIQHGTACRIKRSVRRQQPAIVTYRNGYPCIPAELFYHIVDTFRPVHIHMFICLLQIALIFSLVFVSLFVVSKFNRTKEISGLMHIFSFVFIGFIPRIIQAMASKRQRKLERDEIKRRLRSAIETFMKKQVTFLKD